MTDVDRCLICGEAIPEGMQVCNNCMAQYHFEAEETVEIAEEMRDIAGVLSITANTDGNIKKVNGKHIEDSRQIGAERK